MSNPQPIIFDLDDTLFDTSTELRSILKAEYAFEVDHSGWLSDSNTDGLISKIGSSGRYMSTASMFDGLDTIPALISEYRANGGIVGVCTHRGFHSHAAELSRVAYKRYGLEFDVEHYLCPTDSKCKISYLNALYGSGQYWLFDDNPVGNLSGIITDRQVMVIDRPFNKDIQSVGRIPLSYLPDMVRGLIKIAQ